MIAHTPETQVADERFDFRWGTPIIDEYRRGYADVPGFIMRHYAEAGVKPAHMMAIIHLSAYKYNSPNGQSRPSLNTIAKQMGYAKPDTVRKMVKELESMGLVIVNRSDGNCNTYDFKPLTDLCLSLALREATPPKSGGTPQIGGPLNPGEVVPLNPGGVPPLKSGGEESEYKSQSQESEDSAANAAATPPAQPVVVATPTPQNIIPIPEPTEVPPIPFATHPDLIPDATQGTPAPSASPVQESTTTPQSNTTAIAEGHTPPPPHPATPPAQNTGKSGNKATKKAKEPLHIRRPELFAETLPDADFAQLNGRDQNQALFAAVCWHVMHKAGRTAQQIEALKFGGIEGRVYSSIHKLVKGGQAITPDLLRRFGEFWRAHNPYWERTTSPDLIAHKVDQFQRTGTLPEAKEVDAAPASSTDLYASLDNNRRKLAQAMGIRRPQEIQKIMQWPDAEVAARLKELVS